MKAAVCTRYGTPEVIRIVEREKPIPKFGEILVKVVASALNSGDVRLRKADPWIIRLLFGFTKPRNSVLGSVYSGFVDSVGEGVQKFNVGDMVWGHTNLKMGAHAEYVLVTEDSSIIEKPDGFSHAECASIPFGGLTALYFLQLLKVKNGDKALVVGASGAVGSAAVQLLKAQGAQVTAVCSDRNAEWVNLLGGGTEVRPYERAIEPKDAQVYDVIFDAVNHLNVKVALNGLKLGGQLVLSAAGLKQTLAAIIHSKRSKKKTWMGVIQHSASGMEYLKSLMVSGKYRAIIDQHFTLDNIVAAHRYFDGGQKQGSVVIEMH